MERLAIYIPAYNAASTVTSVLDRIPHDVRASAEEIFVVDNASSDDTIGLLRAFREDRNMTNLEIIRNERNLGYGGSQKVAYKRCLEREFSCIAMLHGDAQYAPEHIKTLIQPVLAGEADMVFGSRIAGHPIQGGMPIHRWLGNRILTIFQNLLLGTGLSEFHSGYRVYSAEALRKIPFDRLSSDYHFDTEIVILLLHHKCRIKEVPIPTHYGDEENYVNIWRYAMDVVVTTLSYFLHKTGLRRSKNWSRILA